MAICYITGKPLKWFGDKRWHARRLQSILSCLLWSSLVLGAGACAKVGDPLPPLSGGPLPVDNLLVARAGDQMRLLFSLPSQDIQSVEVYRLCDNEASPVDPIARVPPREIPSSPDSDEVTFVDTPPRNSFCRYRIRLIGPNSLPSPFSEWAEAAL